MNGFPLFQEVEIHREASTINFHSLEFDVAKLGYTRRKSKKTASTTYFTNPLLINILQKVNLYNTTTGASTENEANDKYLYKGGS